MMCTTARNTGNINNIFFFLTPRFDVNGKSGDGELNEEYGQTDVLHPVGSTVFPVSEGCLPVYAVAVAGLKAIDKQYWQ